MCLEIRGKHKIRSVRPPVVILGSSMYQFLMVVRDCEVIFGRCLFVPAGSSEKRELG